MIRVSIAKGPTYKVHHFLLLLERGPAQLLLLLLSNVGLWSNPSSHIKEREARRHSISTQRYERERENRKGHK